MSVSLDERIDAVITWVDGSDTTLSEKRARYQCESRKGEKGIIAAGVHPTRFSDNGELLLCLSLLKKNASWLNRIFIVTDGQAPSCINEDPFFLEKCSIIDHSEIFRGYEKHLPTFNSRTIETMLWRIPGLAERFIYLNDDFLVVNEVKPHDFFVGNKVVLRGKWRARPGSEWIELAFENLLTWLYGVFARRTRTMHLFAQRRAAMMAGYRWRYLRTPHTPHPMRKSILSKFFSSYPELLEKNIQYRFRSSNQYWPIALSDHLNLRSDNAIHNKVRDWEDFNGEAEGEGKIIKIEKDIATSKLRFLNVAGLEVSSPLLQERLNSMVTEVIHSSRG